MKRIKRDTAVYNLPGDVILRLLVYISRTDLINLSLVNKTYRSELSHLVFAKIKTTWYNLQDDTFVKFLYTNKHHITQVRIVDFYSYGEWQIDVFDRVLNNLPWLKTLLINSFNSSNWLKYRSNSTIRKIQLYNDTNHYETQHLSQHPNPKNINRLNHTIACIPKIFNLHHLERFDKLVSLHLNHYHFNWDDTDPSFSQSAIPVCLQLKYLHLHNCSWEYPFSLDRFNSHNTLVELKLIYADNEAFVLSERFQKFLTNPLQQDCKIRSLSINLVNFTIKKFISLNNLKILFCQENYPNLEILDLRGWIIDQSSLKSVLLLLDEIRIYRLYISMKSLPSTKKFPSLKIYNSELVIDSFI